MDQLANFVSVLLPFGLLSITVVLLVGVLIVQHRRPGQISTSLKRSLQLFKINLMLLAICIAIAAITAQVLTAPLDSFGYPDGPADVQTAEQILDYLQQYNRAITTNTYALLWFLYAFTVWFLTTLYGFARALVQTLLARPYQ